MDTKQPEALRVADDLHHSITHYGGEDAFTFAAYEAEQCVRALHAENERLRTCNKDAQHEIANLQERVQQLGQLARDVNSRRVMELEAQLEAIGAGGVEPLRKRECLHQIIEPQPQPAAQALDAQQYANRYRHIRCFGLPMEAFGDCDSYYGVYTSQTGECLDAAIDAAISALQGSA